MDSCLCGDPHCGRCFPQVGNDPVSDERERIRRLDDAAFRAQATDAFERIYRLACDAENVGGGCNEIDQLLDYCAAFVADPAKIERDSLQDEAEGRML